MDKSKINPLFEVLNDAQFEKIVNNSFLVKHRKGDIIVKQDTPIAYIQFIKKGMVKVYSEDFDANSSYKKINKVIIHKFLKDNSIIDILSLFHTKRHVFTAASMGDSEILYINAYIFNEIIQENGDFSIGIMKLISDDALRLLRNAVNNSSKQVPGRLAQLLLFLSTDIFHSDSFQLPLTRQEFADFISSTKENICRTMTDFKHNKIISLDKENNIIILAPATLKMLSKVG
jgi:CRP/FNR family transcriptional regulator, polysaccharide utilization system transcription regulator